MLRRLLISASNRFVDSHTMFFNDGKSFTDAVGNGRIGTVGNPTIEEFYGETCWKILGANGQDVVYVANNKKFHIKNSGCTTVEFMICFENFMYNVHVFGYSDGSSVLNKMYYGLFSNYTNYQNRVFPYIRTYNYYTGVAGGNTMNESNTHSVPTKTWFHIAIETDNTTSGTIKYNYYVNNKYVTSISCAVTQNDNAENLMQLYFGGFGEVLDNYRAKNIGIKNVRFSNILRYKKKDYTPYVDN